MPMASGAIATQVITTTHRLVTTLEAIAASQDRGIPIRITLAIGDGATIKARVQMKANGITPGIEAMSTAIKAQANTPIHSDSEVQWDQHSKLKTGHEKNALEVDKPIAGLLKDLKRQGMLDETIVIWGGEFGRTPMAQGGDDGRDHHNRSFSMWLAGGGLKRGHVHGETDDFCYSVVRDEVPVHDLHATIMHQLGINHERLTFRHQGRDYRLTDVHGKVVKDILI